MSIAIVEDRERNYGKKSFENIKKIVSKLSSSNYDFLVKSGTKNIEFNADDGCVDVTDVDGNSHQLEFTNKGFSLLCNALGIPPTFMFKLNSDLVYQIFKHRIEQTGDKTFLFRTKDKEVLRSVHSNSYMVYDNIDFLNDLEPHIDDSYEFLRTHITDGNMYLKTVTPKINYEELKQGMIFINSEIGENCIKVSPYIYRLPCTNDMITLSDGFKRPHRGSFDVSGNIIKAFKSIEQMNEVKMRNLNDLKEIPIIYPASTIKNICQRFSVKNDAEKVYECFQNEPYENGFGIVNAFTSAAKSYSISKRVKFENIGSLLCNKQIKLYDHE